MAGASHELLRVRYTHMEARDESEQTFGTIVDLVVDDRGRPQYVELALRVDPAARRLVPWELVRVDESARIVHVARPREEIEDSPDVGGDLIHENEATIRAYFGLPLPERPPDPERRLRWLASGSGVEEERPPDRYVERPERLKRR